MGDEQRKDVMDRLLDSMEATQATVKMIAADTEVTREMVGVVRDRIASVEDRVTALERAENRHVDWRKSASEEDAKAMSDQAAFLRALEGQLATVQAGVIEAKNEARLAFAASSKGLSTISAVKTIQESQNTTLANQNTTLASIESEEKKKPKIPVALAATFNLVVALVYLILELLHRMGR